MRQRGKERPRPRGFGSSALALTFAVVVALGVGVGLPAAAIGQELPAGAPESLGFSSERLAESTRRSEPTSPGSASQAP